MKILYIILLTLLIGGCEKNDSDPLSNSEKVANSEITKAQAFRILEQATFGPTNDDVKEVQTLGIVKWIEQQLNSSSAYDSSSDSHQSHLQRYKAIAKMAEPSTYSSDSDFNNNYHGRTSDYQTAAWFDNVLHGKDQLRQRVAFALSELVVISGNYQGKIKADSVWLTDTSIITGEINYKSLQMDRGAALNCKIIHNWDEKKLKKKNQPAEEEEETTIEQET